MIEWGYFMLGFIVVFFGGLYFIFNFDIDLEGEHHVSAIVYNISGQQVGVVYDGMLSGSSKLNWMAENLASGIYFI